jgi:hypothetical protein
MRLRSRVLLSLAVLALTAIAVFGTLAWRNVLIEQAEPYLAARRFEAIREAFATRAPMLQIDDAGTIHRTTTPSSLTDKPTRLYVMAYRAAQKRLVHALVPFWFLKMKGPGVRYVLGDTGFDLQRLGVTPANLERFGAGIVVDETRPNGDRLLVWLE